ncbi:uncharacterized protein LOC111614473 [Centruroides sculpturatus]|uniref:uncharacterized protein LOC111614473 n=1 Tax=Centruroides sculpturatus TaxID=218467 RepID=UPI000C6EC611|nr:uncharacterized protein LOC111614473 [Centruroides sculpturatus]
MSVYAKLVQAIIFGHFLLTCIHALSTEDNVIACSPLEVTGKSRDNTMFMKGIFACASLICSLTIQYGRRKKIAMELKTSSYYGEKQKMEKYQLLMFFHIIYFYCIVFGIAVFNSSLIIRRFENRSSYTRAFLCVVYNIIYTVFELSVWIWFLTVALIIGIAVKKRFDALSLQLQQANSIRLERNINEIIFKHLELCDFLQQINDKWNEFIFIGYGIILFCMSLLIYNTIFGGLSFHMYMYISICIYTIIGITLGIIGSFAVARLCASAYDSFQEIRKLGAAILPLETKLKMLNFMKKFQRKNIGLSCGDCFVFSKQTPVQTYKALYSVFNMLLQIRDVYFKERRSCKVETPLLLLHSNNTTVST